MRSFVKANQKSLIKPLQSSLEKIMTQNNLRNGFVSEFYSMLISNASETSHGKLMSCNEDLSLTEQDWEHACAKAINVNK